MVTSRLAVRRRPRVERRVLAMLRGEALVAPASQSVSRRRRPATVALPPDPGLIEALASLRQLASEQGFVIQPPATPYIGRDEMRLLAGLAESQRAEGRLPTNVAQLSAAIRAAAMALDDFGLRLSSTTRYAAIP